MRVTKRLRKSYYYLVESNGRNKREGYARYLGTADRIYRDLQELDELRKRYRSSELAGDSHREISQTTDALLPAVQSREQKHYPLIGELYTALMRENHKRCLDVARFLTRHINDLRLGSALNYVTALREGYPYQSKTRKGKRVEDITRYARRMVCAVHACDIKEGHPLLQEFKKVEPLFSKLWNSQQGKHKANGSPSLERVVANQILTV